VSHSTPPATSAVSAATNAGPSSTHGVSSNPTVTGNEDWNTIAPVMFPMAKVSLPRRIQITELNFSGSSVASGATSSENASGETPRS
jgi:hypothetical protein